jgi:Rrf2 family nitric oxide-sensitive transcriptional repressor
VEQQVRLTRYTDNALRCLTLLAVEAGKAVTAAEIARRMRMSEDHLFKVIAGLAAAGFVDTQRGRGGGVRLKGRPDAIRIGAVVRATEESFSLVECFDAETNKCPIAPTCALAGALDRALAAFLAVLDQVTLADVVKHPERLRRLMRVDGELMSR